MLESYMLYPWIQYIQHHVQLLYPTMLVRIDVTWDDFEKINDISEVSNLPYLIRIYDNWWENVPRLVESRRVERS